MRDGVGKVSDFFDAEDAIKPTVAEPQPKSAKKQQQKEEKAAEPAAPTFDEVQKMIVDAKSVDDLDVASDLINSFDDKHKAALNAMVQQKTDELLANETTANT